MEFDLTSVLLAVVGICIAAAFAVLAGTVSARVFFDATRESEDR